MTPQTLARLDNAHEGLHMLPEARVQALLRQGVSAAATSGSLGAGR